MDAKSIEERGKQIAKASSEGDPASTILQLLEPFKNWTATEKLLRQTKIGVTVAKLRQNKDQTVARQATTLVNKWKSDVKKAGAGSGTSSPAPKAANGTASPAPAAKPEEKKKHTVDPEKRNTATDKVNHNVTGNSTRDACVKLMYDGLAFMSNEGRSNMRA